MQVGRWMRRLAIAGVLLCFAVVVFGAYVRLTAAGLGCPDWPGCYGHITPPGAEHSAAGLSAYAGRPVVRDRERAGNPGDANRHLPAEAPHRDTAPAVRHDHARPAVVADAVAAEKLLGCDWPEKRPPCDQRRG